MSAAMIRLVYSRICDRLHCLKIFTHHAGGMIPFLEGRIGPGNDVMGVRTSHVDLVALRRSLKHRPLDYFRRYVADTSTVWASGAIRLAMDFFNEGNIVFATDAPSDPEGGRMFSRETSRAIDEQDISDPEHADIHYRNLSRPVHACSGNRRGVQSEAPE